MKHIKLPGPDRKDRVSVFLGSLVDAGDVAGDAGEIVLQLPKLVAESNPIPEVALNQSKVPLDFILQNYCFKSH